MNQNQTDPDGSVLGYRVYFRQVGSSVQNSLEIPSHNTSQATVQGLEEFSTYQFKVVAFNLFGEGNASVNVNCTTAEDGTYYSSDMWSR